MTKGTDIWYSNNGEHVWVDLKTGDVEVTYPDGRMEKIVGADPRAKAYWNPYGLSNE